MKLYKLIGLEINDLNNEYKNTLALIKKYKSILKEKSMADDIIIEDITNIKKEYGTKRKTHFEDAEEIVIEEEAKEVLDVVYVQDKFGYAKLLDPSNYEKNKEVVDEENKYIYTAKTSDKALIFGSKGMMYMIKLDDVPMGKVKDKGKPVDNMSKFDSSKESLVGCFLDKNIKDHYFFMCTKEGLIKYVDTKLNDTDELAAILLTLGDKDVVIRTNDNFFLRLNPKDLPELGKTTKGVKGIKLSDNDYVVDCYLYDENLTIKIGDKNVSLNTLSRGTRANKGTHIKI